MRHSESPGCHADARACVWAGARRQRLAPRHCAAGQVASQASARAYTGGSLWPRLALRQRFVQRMLFSAAKKLEHPNLLSGYGMVPLLKFFLSLSFNFRLGAIWHAMDTRVHTASSWS